MNWRRPVTVLRQHGSYVDGIWQAGEPEAITIQASVQPIAGHELICLPSGRQAQARYRLYTGTKLQTVTDENPDKVIFDEAYEVLAVAAFQSGIMNHYRIIIGNAS